ncbi:MAG: hypothetical protein JO253_03195 [Alphaproteobacteria bacterium]|nr:hypothetical protein [Alphaproteobacteria bacterium]
MEAHFAALVARDVKGRKLGVPSPVFGPYFNHLACEKKIEAICADEIYLRDVKESLAARLKVDFTLTVESYREPI